MGATRVHLFFEGLVLSLSLCWGLGERNGWKETVGLHHRQDKLFILLHVHQEDIHTYYVVPLKFLRKICGLDFAMNLKEQLIHFKWLQIPLKSKQHCWFYINILNIYFDIFGRTCFKSLACPMRFTSVSSRMKEKIKMVGHTFGHVTCLLMHSLNECMRRHSCWLCNNRIALIYRMWQTRLRLYM